MKLNQILMMLAAMMVLLGAATKVQATARTASVSGNWSSTATWSATGIPVAGDTVTINTGINVTNDAAQACASIVISGSGTLIVNNTLGVSGNVTVGSGGGTGATLTIASVGTISVGGTYGYNGTTPVINNNGTFSCAGGAAFSTGSFNNNGKATFTGSAQEFNGTYTLTQGANATLDFSGNSSSTPFGGTPTTSLSASGNTVIYAGGANMRGGIYFNVTVTGNSSSAGASTTVNGTLTIKLNSGQQVNSANNITMGNNSTIIRTLGALSGTPTFPASPNYVNVIYNNTAAMTTGSELPANVANLTLTNTTSSANKVTLNSGTTVNGTLAVTYLTTPATGSGATVLTAASGKTLTLSSSPVTINLPGSTITGGGSPYTVVSGGSTFVSGTLGTITVQGAGAPASSSVAINSGQLTLAVGPTIFGGATTTAFSTTYGTASGNQSFAVSGVNLTADLVATAGTGFEVATSSGGTYGSSVTFTQSGGSAGGTVFVRLKATASAGAYNSANAVVLSSTGATTLNIATPSSGNAVNKATAGVTVTPYSVTYDGSAHTASAGTVTGVNGETGATVGTVTLTGTTHTAAGTYATDSWTLTGGANYNNITAQTITDTIGKATPGVTVTPYSVTYDSHAHTASAGTVTGVNGETGATVGTVVLTGTTHTAAGTYASDSWSLTGGANYNNISATTITDTIGNAAPGVTVTPYTVTYDGNAHTASVGTITGVNGETGATVGSVSLSTTHTAAGTYASDSWSLTGGANYNNISDTTITDTIGAAALSFSGLSSLTNSYGVTNITLTGTLSASGPVYPASGETVSATINGFGANGTVTDDTGDFSITFNDPSLATNDVVGSPYTITYDYAGNANLAAATDTSTSLTITNALLSITANNDSKCYGDTRSYGAGSTAFTSTGLVNGETVGTVTIKAGDSPSGTEATDPAGNYDLTSGTATGGTFDPNNYLISYNNGTLTVNPLPATSAIIGPDSVAPLSSATYSVTPTAGSSYSWTVPSDASFTGGTGNSINVTFGSTSDNVSVTETSSSGCTGTPQNLYVTVTSGCTAPVIEGGIDPGDTTLCAGSSLVLTLTNVTGAAPLFYQWQTNGVDILDATNASYTNLSVTLADMTNYVCIVSNSCGSVTSFVATVTVNPLPTVSVNSETICAGGSATLTATTGASSPAYQWNDPANSTTASITVSPSSTTTYTVTVTDGTTGCVNGGSGTVTVNPLPTVSVNSETVCAGGSTTLTATTSASSPGYQWNDPASSTTASITVSPSSTTTYTVTVTDGTTGCVNGGSGTVTVNPLPTVNVNSTAICAGGSATLTATTSASSPGYQWNDPASSTTASITVSPSSTTTYTVTVLDGTTGCANGGSGTVTVNPLPTVSVNSETVCAGDSATLTATTSAGSPGYLWSDSETTASITVSPSSTTTYTVTVTDGTTGCVNGGSGTVTMNSVNASNVTYNATIGYTFQVAESNLLNNASGTGGVTLTSVQSPSANGVTVTNIGGQIFYLANVTNTDTFTYTVAAVTGACTATGTVTLNPIHPVGSATIEIPANGMVTIQFFGIPGTNYVVETATNVIFMPYWTLSTNTAGSDGSWMFTDPNATNQQQYYRSTLQP